MYSREEEIIHFIFKAFKNQKRKKEDIELVFHSIIVGNMLKNLNLNEELVYVGYLHDVIEDTDYDYEYLLRTYGSFISKGVQCLSEDKSIKDYKLRKTKFLNRLNTIEQDLLYVELADKLSNLTSDYDLYLEKGKDSLITEAESFENLKWYYISLQKLFNKYLEHNILLDRYNKIINLYFDESYIDK